MKLCEIVTPDRVTVLEEGERLDKRGCLERLAELLARGIPAAPERILAVLEEREALQTTGIGDGVAMPHGTLEGAAGQVGALLICPGGADFESIDDKPANILFAVVGPRHAVEHLKVLARISKVLRSSGFRERLLEQRDARSAFHLLSAEDDAVSG
ncbi:MAG: PTS sugar transporter subunit IIA [Polyangiaceae bacterium]|nr:PTS sugar transporter subunit IIA [Polyangiaceae bacterium]